MKTWDVIVVGAGIIGLSISIALRKRGAQVLVVERGEPGREASHAAAGMLAAFEVLAPLRSVATASATMYPEFAHELRDESGVDIDLREHGTLVFGSSEQAPGKSLSGMPLAELEPVLVGCEQSAVYLKERSVDPRALVAAALKAAKHREVDISSGTTVVEIRNSAGRVTGVRSDKTSYSAPVVVNCAGAWSGQLPPRPFPTRPVRGQMLAVAGAHLHHVLRFPDVYLVPRSDGRIVIGSTAENAGFDKRVDAETIQRLREAAIRSLPALRSARMLETWAGLRPGTPDDLPILGATEIAGYFVATGHFRDGILLAPVTAKVMSQLITGAEPEHDISAFSATRFAT